MMNNEINFLSELLQKYVDDSGEVIIIIAQILYNWSKPDFEMTLPCIFLAKMQYYYKFFSMLHISSFYLFANFMQF